MDTSFSLSSLFSIKTDEDWNIHLGAFGSLANVLGRDCFDCFDRSEWVSEWMNEWINKWMSGIDE
jgi:hypothetical protein